VRLLEDLRPCRFFLSCLGASTEKDLVWVDRLDPSIVLGEKKKPEFFLVDGDVPMKPLFSPEAPSSAPPSPPFVLSWDPGDVSQLPCSALIEVVLQKRSDIASLCRIHQDTKDCENGDELTEKSRFAVFAWESVTEAFRDKTYLRSPFVSWCTPNGVSKGDVFRATRPDARFRAEAAAAIHEEIWRSCSFSRSSVNSNY
jgi:hypothetical protein